MQSPFDPIAGQYFLLQPELPSGYRGLVLQGASAESYTAGESRIILQRFVRPEFSLQFSILEFFSVIRMIIGDPAFAAGSLLSYLGNVRVKEENGKEIRLKENQFSFFGAKKKNVLLDLKGGEHQLLEVSWCADMMAEAMPLFPSLRDAFTNINKITPSSSFPIIGRPAGYHALDIVETLLKSPFDGELTDIFFQYRVREYLLFLLTETSDHKKTTVYLTGKQKKDLHELRIRMLKDPKGKFPINTIAAETNMSSIRLKVGFKQEFGESIFAFHLKSRFKEAHRMLAETDEPTKAIALAIGYRHTTSFITKFRKIYGYPPSEVPKRR